MASDRDYRTLSYTATAVTSPMSSPPPPPQLRPPLLLSGAEALKNRFAVRIGGIAAARRLSEQRQAALAQLTPPPLTFNDAPAHIIPPRSNSLRSPPTSPRIYLSAGCRTLQRQPKPEEMTMSQQLHRTNSYLRSLAPATPNGGSSTAPPKAISLQQNNRRSIVGPSSASGAVTTTRPVCIDPVSRCCAISAAGSCQNANRAELCSLKKQTSAANQGTTAAPVSSSSPLQSLIDKLPPYEAPAAKTIASTAEPEKCMDSPTSEYCSGGRSSQQTSPNSSLTGPDSSTLQSTRSTATVLYRPSSHGDRFEPLGARYESQSNSVTLTDDTGSEENDSGVQRDVGSCCCRCGCHTDDEPPDFADYANVSADLDPPSRNAKQQTFPDAVLRLIFCHLTSDELVRLTRVSKRWQHIIWTTPFLWTRLHFTPERQIDASRALFTILRRLQSPTLSSLASRGDVTPVIAPSPAVTPTPSHPSRRSPKSRKKRVSFCPDDAERTFDPAYPAPMTTVPQLIDAPLTSSIRDVLLAGCSGVTDELMLELVASCPALSVLDLRACRQLSDYGLGALVLSLPTLQELYVAGCDQISLDLATKSAVPASSQLRTLDLSDCPLITDSAAHGLPRLFPRLKTLYVRNCTMLTDAGLSALASQTRLRELSVCGCQRLSDIGLCQLARASLRYLSLAGCDRVTSAGVAYLAQRCSDLRYLNLHKCSHVTDDAVSTLVRHCRKLKSLDVSYCSIGDSSLAALADVSSLRRLNVKGCSAISDDGLVVLATVGASRGNLAMLNVQACDRVGVSALRMVKRHNRRCVIQHSLIGCY